MKWASKWLKLIVTITFYDQSFFLFLLLVVNWTFPLFSLHSITHFSSASSSSWFHYYMKLALLNWYFLKVIVVRLKLNSQVLIKLSLRDCLSSDFSSIWWEMISRPPPNLRRASNVLQIYTFFDYSSTDSVPMESSYLSKPSKMTLFTKERPVLTQQAQPM